MSSSESSTSLRSSVQVARVSVNPPSVPYPLAAADADIPELPPSGKRRTPKAQQRDKAKADSRKAIDEWLPVIAGVAMGIAAPYLSIALEALAPWGNRFVFPFVQLAALPEVGMSDTLTRTLPPLMLYLQFPLEGFLTRNSLRRGISRSSALSQILFLHLIGALVLWLVAVGTGH